MEMAVHGGMISCLLDFLVPATEYYPATNLIFAISPIVEIDETPQDYAC